MLRFAVLFFALLNVLLFLWIRSDPSWWQSDREPLRVSRQLAASAVQVLPDAPEPPAGEGSAAGAAAGASSASSVVPGAPGAVQGPSGASAAVDAPAASGAGRPASQAAATTAATGGDGADCRQSGPLTEAQSHALMRRLLAAGVAAPTIHEDRGTQAARWIVYMGRFADETQWQHKADELRRLGLHFDRVSAPETLDPGLSLGSFASAEGAQQRLDDAVRHGVRSARVLQAAAAADWRQLQVRPADARVRAVLDRQRFTACAAGGVTTASSP